MRKIVIAAVLLAAAGVVIYLVLRAGARKTGTTITVSGNIEIVDAEVSFRIPGRVTSREVDEGWHVEEGQLVARLDDTDLGEDVAQREADVQALRALLDELLNGSRPQEIAASEATVERLQAALDELLNGSRPQEITAAEASAAGARADLDRWKLDYERQVALLRGDVISAREFDATRAAWESAVAHLEEAEARLELAVIGPRQEAIDQARAALAEAAQRLSLVREGPRIEQIEQARARLEQSRQGLAMARTRLGYATLRSPLTGIVLSKNIEPGEYVFAGTPIVTVGDLVNVWLRAYVEETDLGRVKVGQTARVTTDSYPGRSYAGRVSFIASQAEFTPKSVQTRKERVKLVYRIKIDVSNPEMELKAGMPADAEIDAGPQGEER